MTDPNAGRQLPAQGGMKSTRALHYLKLDEDAGLEKLWDELLGDTEIVSHTLADQAEAALFGGTSELHYSIARVPEKGAPLTALRPVQIVLYPPLILFGDRDVSRDELETLRRQGAVAVVEPDVEAPGAGFLQRALGGSLRRYEGPIELSDPVDVLHRMAQESRSGVLVAACPHTPAITSAPWEAGGEECGGDSSCPGCFVRVYVKQGHPVFAEAPQALGADALSAVFRLKSGYVRVHETLLMPQEVNLPESLEHYLLLEAKHQDVEVLFEDGRGTDEEHQEHSSPAGAAGARPYKEGVAMNFESDREDPSGPSDRPGANPFPRDDEQPGELDQLLSLSPGLHTAAIADSDGNVTSSSGEWDGSEICAVAVMGQQTLAKAVEALGLGELEQYCADGGGASLYLHSTESGLIVLGGTAGKNPNELLEVISKRTGGRS